VRDGDVGLLQVRIRGFRSARDVTLAPGPLCALVGEARAGKSNVLYAIWTLLEPGAPAPRSRDAWVGGDGRILIEADVGRGQTLHLEAAPPQLAVGGAEAAPPVLLLPAAERSRTVLAATAATDGPALRAATLLRRALGRERAASSAAAAAALLAGWIDACVEESIRGLVLLIEEPELFLRPQAQRYLYRQLRAFASAGNQVVYATHAPAFLTVARIEELALVEHRHELGTVIVQPERLAPDESFRILSEFDAERSELFLSRATLLVEGRTEKLVFPFVFRALGHDPDREGISIVECGGKPNIVLFARICDVTGIPYVVVHDRDAPAGRDPIPAERAVNDAIRRLVPAERTVVLEPDFEAVAGLHGHSHKPERA
jgi:predicted ATP-dependent endonuclease of OLD family